MLLAKEAWNQQRFEFYDDGDDINGDDGGHKTTEREILLLSAGCAGCKLIESAFERFLFFALDFIL